MASLSNWTTIRPGQPKSGRVISTTPALPDATAKAGSQVQERYRFRLHRSQITVTCSLDGGTGWISCRSGHACAALKLRVPPGWRITHTRADNCGLPGVILWKAGPGVAVLVFVVIRKVESYNWQYRGLLLCQVDPRSLRLLPLHPETFEFDNVGGFRCVGRMLYVWDAPYKMGYALYHARRYVLRRWMWRRSSLEAEPSLRTKRRHELYRIDLWFQPLVDDPLHEFGLHWRWWSDARIGC